jgi:outer membrane protein assembly factor BamA
LKHRKLGLIILLTLVVAACSPTRRLREGEYLLVKNSVVESKPLKKSERDDISDYVLPRTNKKFLGFWRFYLQIYNLPNPEKLALKKEKQLVRLNDKNQKIAVYNSTVTNPKKIKKFKKERLLFGEWLQKNGEPPVLLDSVKIRKSKELLTNYAQNKGFFQAWVSDSVVLKKKKATVVYTVHRGRAYYIDTIFQAIKDPAINYYITANESKTKLKNGMKYDLQKLDDERTRITEILKNNGYYFFSKDYLKYTADTVTDSGYIRLSMKLINPDFPVVQEANGTTDTIRITEHKKFKINEIYVIPNFQIDDANILSVDTVKYKEYTFIFYNKKNYNPKIIAQSIFFQKGQYYSSSNEVKTQKAISELRNFKYINIHFKPIFTNDKNDLLNCIIELSPMPKQNLGLEAQGTNTAGNLGISLSASYVNKNMFKGAEYLEFKFYGGAEISTVTISNSLGKNVFGPFNTFEVGVNASLLSNRFLLPIKIARVAKWVKPKSRFSLGVNFQTRPDYSRTVGSFTFGYEWSSSARIKHVLNPAEISYVSVIKTDTFEKYINSINDQFVLNSFISHYIQGASYTFLYNSLDLNARKDFIFFRGNIQWGGNILGLVSKLGNDVPDAGGYHTVFGGIRYSQYVRTELDFRYYLHPHKYHSFAFRGFVGIGIPYGNSRVMPFEKAFFIGGSNDLRAFLPRTMGPGSYSQPGITRVDQVGDLKILVNAEYRGKIYKFLEGAIFGDFGNIWLLSPDPDRPGGEFTGKFIEEFAFGAGVGLRLNFGFFIFRLDVALPFRDPRKPVGERWVIGHITKNDVNVNIAVGYPF